MIEGIRCPPGVHKYRAYGKVLFCASCADVQPLLLDEPVVSPQGVTRNHPPAPEPEEAIPETIPASDEAQMDMLRNLRDLVAKGGVPDPAQMDLLGERREWDGNLSDLEMQRDLPRARVDEGYNTDPREDRLPSAGL